MSVKSKRIKVIAAAAVIIIAVALCICACKPTVIDKLYYVYDYDISSLDNGRQVAAAYEEVTVTIRTKCEYRKGLIALGNRYTKTYEPLSGAIISADGYILTALHGVRGGIDDSNPDTEVYTYEIFHTVTEGGEAQVRQYEAEFVSSRPSEDIALLKIKDAHNLKYANLNNYADAVNGEASYIFYSYDNRGNMHGVPMVSTANIGAVKVSSEKYSSSMGEACDDAVYRAHFINVITAELPACAMGGIIVNSQGKITGMAFSRLISSTQSDWQSSHIYGLSAVTTIDAIRNLCADIIDGR